MKNEIITAQGRKKVLYFVVILLGIVSAPLVPDELLPRSICKATLGGALGGLLVVVVEKLRARNESQKSAERAKGE